MKTIVIYTESLKPSGGRERVIVNLIIRWVKMYSVVVIVKDEGESFYELPEGIIIKSIKSQSNNQKNKILEYMHLLHQSIIVARALKKILCEIKFDYLYVATPQNALEAYFAMKDPANKLVISEHASINAFNSFYSFVKKVIYPKAYCISVPNKMDTEEYKKWKCKAIYIPHIVSFKVSDSEKKNKIFLNVGRLMGDKQQDKLINAWSKINDHNEWKLWIVGEGNDYQKLLELIKATVSDGSVSILGARKDIENIYKQASVFVLSSRCEGFGMVLIEAMSFGVPCISFDCPSGPRDIIKDGINGFLVKNGDVYELSQRMKQFIYMDKEQYIGLCNSTKRTIEEWDNDAIIKKWDQKVFK